MSDLMLHPIVHSRNVGQYATPQDVENARNEFSETANASLLALQDYLDKGYKILDSWNDSHTGYNIRQVLLHMPDDSEKSIKNVSTHVLTSIEVKNTYSKTHAQEFDYFTCGFDGNNRVNIFDHPDPSRNTWEIVKNRGWTWEKFQDAIYNSYPVSATLSYDGDWYTLIDVVSIDEYNAMCEIIDSMNGAKDNDEA